jgi:hypothetical protein
MSLWEWCKVQEVLSSQVSVSNHDFKPLYPSEAGTNETEGEPMPRNLKLQICHDSLTEQPDAGYDGWRLVSFGRKHASYEDPPKYVKAFDRRTKEVKAATIGLAKRLNVGLAFWLSYYEHGQGAWSLIGEGTQCRFDTAYLAGLLIWTGKAGDIGARTLEGRAEDARDFLDSYNAWANGETFWFKLTDVNGQEIESFGGLIGDESVSEVVGEALEAGDNVKIEGDAAWLKNHLTLPEGVNLVEEFPEPTAA